MAGRSVLQKLVSAMSRSRALVARGGASAAVAAAPERGIRTLSHLSHRGGVAVHPGSAVPEFLAAHTSKIFPSNRGIHRSATRNFDCSRVTAKPSYLTSRIPSVIIDRVKPTKRTFSSTASTAHEFTEWEAKQDADSERFWRNIKWLYGFAGFNILLGVFLDRKLKRIRSIKCKCKNRSRNSPICPSCSRTLDAAKAWPSISSGWWD